MPICEQVHQIVHEGRDVRAAVDALMRRALRSESD
jgi:glycerol-3-phosphate dehydrogenase